MTHHLKFDIRGRITIFLVGCGGTGCAVAAGLPYLDQALQARGGAGIRVLGIDGDRIEEHNRVRQPFAAVEVGLYKSVVLINRLNLMWGLDWSAFPVYFTDDMGEKLSYPRGNTILISCVDSRKARKTIASALPHCNYWLDIGNTDITGQFVLGEARDRKLDSMPCVHDLFPAIIDPSEDDNRPTCSALEALEQQQPFTNQVLAAHALSLLGQLLWGGQISYHGGFVNLRTGEMNPLPVDPESWKKRARKQKAERARAAKRSRAAVLPAAG